MFDPSPNILAGYDPTGQGQMDDITSINPSWSQFMRVLRQRGGKVTMPTPANPNVVGGSQLTSPTSTDIDQRLGLALKGLSGVK